MHHFLVCRYACPCLIVLIHWKFDESSMQQRFDAVKHESVLDDCTTQWRKYVWVKFLIVCHKRCQQTVSAVLFWWIRRMSAQNNNQEPQTDSEETKQCRICFDTDDPNDIISPCLCSGGSAYVHRKCLNRWRSENKHGRGFKICNVCQFEYVIEPVTVDPKGERERLWKYYFLVIRDSTIFFLFIQLFIVSVTFLLKAIDRKHETIKHFYPDSMHAFSIYYVSSIVILLAIIGAISLIVIYFAVDANRSSRRSSSTCNCGATAIIAACVLAGFIVGLICSVIIVKKIMEQHARKLWLRQEADKYVVRDFQGRRSELENYRRPTSL